MTPTPASKEVAEKIWDDLEGRRMGKTIRGIWVLRLMSELEAFAERAREEKHEDCFRLCDEAWIQGRIRGLLKAVKVAQHKLGLSHPVTKELEALAGKKEEGK